MRVTAALLTLAALAGCFPRFEERGCWRSSECAAGQVCRGGACVAAAAPDGGERDVGESDLGAADQGVEDADAGAADADGGGDALPPKDCVALELAGPDDYVRAPYQPSMDFKNEFLAVEAWIYLPEPITTTEVIVTRTDAQGNPDVFEFYAYSTALNFCVYDSAAGPPPYPWRCISTRGPLPVGRWFHLLGAYTHFFIMGTEVHYVDIWIDGRSVTDNTGGIGLGFVAVRSPPSPIDVGGRTDGFVSRIYPFSGRIASLRVSNRVPPAYVFPVPPTMTPEFTPETELSAFGGAVLVWRLDEGTGQMATDTSTQANHGRIEGPAWVEDGPGCH